MTVGAGLLTAGEFAPVAGCTARGAGRLSPDNPSGTLPEAGKTLDVRDFGAVGDGRTDDTRALSAALAAVRPGQALLFAAGETYLHADVLSVETADVRLTGGGVLVATDEQASALRIAADGVLIDGLTLAISHTSQRWSAPAQHKLHVDSCAGVLVRDVTITGSAAAGVFCQSASGFVLQRVAVRDTRADGIHLTDGSSSGLVDAPDVTRSGDDGVAVVSYASDSAACHDIRVANPRVRDTTGGRGLSVVGGRGVRYEDVDVAGTSAAAVYIACEGGDFVTSDTSEVVVTGGRISDANTDARIDHGAVLVYSGRSGGAVRDVLIEGLTISGTRAGASRQIGVVADGPADAVSGIVFSDLLLAADPRPYQGDAAPSAVSLRGVTADGVAVTP